MTTILAAYFTGNDRLGLFGIFYVVLLIFGLFIWTGKTQTESNAFIGFIFGTVGLFVISVVVGAVSKQWSFLASTTPPAWMQTASTSPPPTFLSVPIPQLLNTVMNVPGPIAEESFFRVFLWRATSPALGKKKMLIGQAIIFGVVHYFAYGGSITQMIVAMVAGVFLGLLYWWTNSELAIASSHLIYNLGAMVISATTGIVLMKV